MNKEQEILFKSEIIPLYNSGTSINKLMKLFHLGKRTISNGLKELGIEVKNTHTEIKFNDHIFDVIDTEEKAYWLGFIWADGNIKTPKNSSGYRLTITLQESDYEHLVKFNNFIGHKNLNIKSHKANTKKFSWYADSKHLWNTLNSYGCTPNKSLTLTFPELSVFVDKSLVRHFIRGYFDGDGCLTFSTRKGYIVPSLSLLGTLDIVNNIKMYSNLNEALVRTRHGKNDYYELKLDLSESKLFMEYLYEDCNIYLDRKYNRYNLFKSNNHKIINSQIKVINAFGIEA